MFSRPFRELLQTKIVYLYATNATEQYNYIKAANDKGYNVLLLDGQLDNHFVGLLERKLENTSLVRVDSDVVSNLIRKSDKKVADLTPVQRTILSAALSASILSASGRTVASSALSAFAEISFITGFSVFTTSV